MMVLKLHNNWTTLLAFTARKAINWRDTRKMIVSWPNYVVGPLGSPRLTMKKNQSYCCSWEWLNWESSKVWLKIVSEKGCIEFCYVRNLHKSSHVKNILKWKNVNTEWRPFLALVNMKKLNHEISTIGKRETVRHKEEKKFAMPIYCYIRYRQK